MERPIQFPVPEGCSKVHVYHNKQTSRFIVLKELGRGAIECSWDGESAMVHDVQELKLFV